MENENTIWAESDIDILTRLYPHDSLGELALVLDRSRKSIKNKAHKLNIKRAFTAGFVSYVVSLKRSHDHLTIYSKIIPANKSNNFRRDELIKQWNKKHYSKLITGEWYLSVTNNLDKF